jgi:uncharacterized membrane protein YbhN (UPF0104 family)
VAIIVATLALSTYILVSVFDDLDWNAVVDALRSLDDAEIIAVVSLWILWIGCQGLQTASMIAGLPVRRGVIAFLGPASVTSVVPGPSDLPVRFRMLRSWGHSTEQATLAVAAGGFFSIGIKLVLPVIAAIGLVISDTPIDGTLRTIVIIALLVGVGLVIFGIVFRSERRTIAFGRMLDPLWRAGLKLIRRKPSDPLGDKLVEARTKSLDILRDRWLIASWGTTLTAVARFGLLLMAVRFTGLPEDAASWPQVFVVYAIVQGLTVLPITAGDTGVSEVAYIGLLTAAAGQDYVNQITAGVLLFRLLTWLVIISSPAPRSSSSSRSSCSARTPSV